MRPDLITGRTLMGHSRPNQRLRGTTIFRGDSTRVMAFMKDLSTNATKLGIPVKTRHNEVAPNQFRTSSHGEEANLNNDHNQLLMTIMDKIQHLLLVSRLCCTKSTSRGINGSGKHNNWSLGTDTGVNLFGTGKTASENLQFITFLVNVTVNHKYNGLLKASIMKRHERPSSWGRRGASGHHFGLPRLAGLGRAGEAGRLEGRRRHPFSTPKAHLSAGGISHIPTLLLDNTDRNRTSPFAFTGNRFEFRAVGSSDNCAEAMIVLNTAMAHELTEFRRAVDAKIEAGAKKEKAIYEVLKQMIHACRDICFDGNGYSEEWKAEAARRGLDCETSTPRIFDRYLDRDAVRMFGDMGVLSEVELQARTEVKWETYTKKIQIEGRVLGDLAMNHIVPIASKYEALLLDKVYKMSQIPGLNASADIALIKKIQDHTAAIQKLTGEMIDARKVANRIEDQREKAVAYHDTVASCFDAIRYHIDKLEEIVDDQIWPLPKYRELLFLR